MKNTSLGNKSGSVGPGDVVLCGGQWAVVGQVEIIGPGHHVTAIRKDLTAVVVHTDRGDRFLGAHDARIMGDLRVHWVRLQ